MGKLYSRVGLGLCTMMLSLSSIFAQNTTISGTVTDAANGEPLVGVTVVQKGTTRGAVTDLDGNYTLTVSQDAILVFSIVGFRTLEVSAGEAGDLQLPPDVTNLDEIVVTGLASSVKRSNLGNAVATVSGEELTGVTSQSTLDGALYGKLTGANIVQTSGAPGGGFAIRLRGVSSIFGNNQPLFIIDGVYINNSEIPSGSRFASGANNGEEEQSSNRIADLDPNDIENIEVLKGPSAAAIYGTRANAGVVIITTKRGAQGKTQVSLKQDIGFQEILNPVGRRTFTAEQVEQEFGAADRAAFEAAQAAGQIFDYEDVIFGEKGFITDTRLNVKGGNANTSFYMGIGVRNEDGIVDKTGFDRRSIRLNVDHQISDRIKLSLSSNYVNSEAARSFSGNENEGGLSYGYTLAFTRDWVNLFPDEFGNYPDNPNYPGNPLLTRDLAKNDEQTNRFIQGAQLDINAYANDNTSIRFKLNGGVDFYLNETFVYVPEFQQAQRGTTNGFIANGKNTSFNRNLLAFGIFDKYLGSLTLSTQVGVSYLNFDRDFILTQTTQLIPGQTNASQGGSQEVQQEIIFEEEFGFVVQQEANFDDKVILSAGVRFDKSSLNGDPNKYFAFPKASAAVNLANFDFWNVSAINAFKVRAAYGETGNSPRFGALYTTFDATNINGNPGVVVGLNRGDATLEPETAKEFETGFDVSFLDGALGLVVTYYNKQIEDLLYERSVPSSSGFTFQIVNDADLKNEGLEIGLNARPVSSSNFNWNTFVNFWFNRSELTRLEGPPITPRNTAFGTGLGSFFLEEGQPITQLVGSTADGLVQVGDVEPDFQISFYNQMNIYKNFDLSFLIHWKEGGDNLNLTRLLTDIGGTTPRDIEPLENPDFFIEDASYVRLREISLYYTIPLESNFLGSAKVGVSARNLFTITNYSGYDPEVSTKGGSRLSSGVDVAPFPSAKQYYFHIAFEF